jgi:hypothetical protein
MGDARHPFFREAVVSARGLGQQVGADDELAQRRRAFCVLDEAVHIACGVRKYDLAGNKLDPDGGRVYAPHRR